ncbi:MAG: 5-histidylcysteine sulfoxide synthase [Moorea sp. SIOASIH]|uniref:5-histidylcysteine sulfoxide synthase n=1 Tax=Moorena sp. SIOASIH TaxID=2607817 RepID=UPI0013B6EC83|nr:5-histidylcysteine sulfoxide synthase [Moorena sp. SIOASIH]NEO41757.1 5-histidylcysteine sulfoxide synthase [Moorena sp. SIOASIH]
MDTLQSTQFPRLDTCSRESILNYFKNSWELEDVLIKSLVGEETFYISPDPLRNRLIFYLGHSAVFYINKFLKVGLLDKPINPNYEILFEIGVDPETPEELDQATKDIHWPKVEEVWRYRDQVYGVIIETIKRTPLNLPIHQNHPLWALMMGIEHSRTHFETSSMLIRQLPVERLERPDSWNYAVSNGKVSRNEMLQVSGGSVALGKPEDYPIYGWDSEYGNRSVEVKPFFASQYLITNGEFLEFVNDNGYDNPDYWDKESWTWKTTYNIKHPKFWIPTNGGYNYRALFDEIDLPLDWPVEVNHHEAMAYCRWKGKGIRLMSEAEWNLATAGRDESSTNFQQDPFAIEDYNLNLKFGSPSPVGMLETAKSPAGLYDLRGNVWEWLSDDFKPLPGFKPHRLYEDYSAPFFDTQHNMMLGGAWVTTGTEASTFYRNWFRPYFYQHAGFRIAVS